MSARDAILSKIRRSLHVQGSEAGRRAMVIARLEGAPKGIIPARGQLPPEERVALFTSMAETVSATVKRVAGGGEHRQTLQRMKAVIAFRADV